MGLGQVGTGFGPFLTKESDNEWMPANEKNRMNNNMKEAMMLISRRKTEASSKIFRKTSSQKDRLGNHRVNEKPQFFNYASTSADGTASTFSSSVSVSSSVGTKSPLDDGAEESEDTFKTPHFPSVQSCGSQDFCYGQYLTKQETAAFKLHKHSIQQSKDDSLPVKTRRPSRLRASSPFHDRLAERETKSLMLRRAQENVTEDTKLCRIPNDPSPLHERLAKRETFSTASKRNKKPSFKPTKPPYYTVVKSDCTHISKLTNPSPMNSRTCTSSPTVARRPSPAHERHHALQPTLSFARKTSRIKARAPSPRPFYTLVTKGSFTGRDDVSEITMRQPTPSRQRGNSICSNPDQHLTTKDPRPYSRLYLPPSSKSEMCPFGDKPKKEQKELDMHLKQDALYRRLASLDTIASSRMKAIPLNKRMLCPYERKKITEKAERDALLPSGPTEVYTRLISSGNKAAMQKQRYSEDYHDTFAKTCKNSLLRKFEGSTFVRV